MAHTPETRKRALQNVLQRRVDWLQENGPCVVCGSENNLEVDHIDPATKFTHRIWSYSEVRRTEELSKCQVLCFDCHKKKTSEWKRSFVEHGSERMYWLGCRCDPCRNNWNTKKNNRRRPQVDKPGGL